MSTAVEIIKKHEKLPCKMSRSEGEILAEVFEFAKSSLNNQEESRTIEYFYKYEIEGEKYVLIEEFLFKEQDEAIDISKAIDKNYFLYKKEG
jgi:hypothetical protein